MKTIVCILICSYFHGFIDELKLYNGIAGPSTNSSWSSRLDSKTP